MSDGSKNKKTKTQYFLWLIIILCLFSALVKRIYGEKEKIKTTETADSNKKQPAFPYRVITALDSSQYLIAYEFHKDDSENASYGAICDKYPKYSAIIKSINPAKDDYKTVCRSVISDIQNSLPLKFDTLHYPNALKHASILHC